MNYDVVVIGSGVAGMTAALYLKRARVNFCIIEHDTPGGQITTISEIENYPGFSKIAGPDLAFNIFNQLQELKVDYIYEDVKKIEIQEDKKTVITDKQSITTKFIIIATGRSPRKLGLEHEDELLGKGISYCAICDGTLYKDREVVVVGGGDSALQEAMYLSNICKKVTLIHRREILRARNNTLEELEKKDNVSINLNRAITELKIENEKLAGVVLDNGEQIKCDGCFIFIGYEPKTTKIDNLEIANEQGYIEVDEKMQTKVPGVYAIGDSRKKDIYQIIGAMNDGIIAALDVAKNNRR